MTQVLPRIPGRAVAAALAIEKGPERIGPALWLYVALLAAANYRGLVVRKTDRLAQDLGVPEQQVQEWLAPLVGTGLIEILSPAPYLAIRLRFWSGVTSSEREKPPESSGETGSAQLEVPVSSSNAAAAAAALHTGEDGGPGEGEELLGEVLATLDDDADPEELRQLLAQHDPEVVRRALRRVETTSPEQIRKSRTALFRYLLTKLS
jgi:hypothetical protein